MHWCSQTGFQINGQNKIVYSGCSSIWLCDENKLNWMLAARSKIANENGKRKLKSESESGIV